MKAVIENLPAREADIVIPSSKSLTHRALIAASLAHGTSVIKDAVRNKDTEATVRILRLLGAKIREEGSDLVIEGTGGAFCYDGTTADCNESGSTLRFVIPLFALTGKPAKLTGHGKLMQRPLSVYEEIFEKQGLPFEQDGQILCLQGPLKAGDYTVRGDVSSQFISGLLFALPLADSDSTLTVLPPYESRSYVGLTINELKKAGIVIEEDGDTMRIPGNQVYQPFVSRVPGDDSQMAFFACFALIKGVPVSVHNAEHSSAQGDHVIVDLIRRFGGKAEEIEDGYRFEPGELHAIEADLSDCPDLGPALFVLASQAEGTTVFTHCERLRLKESDRIACMEEEMKKLGCEIRSERDTVYVTGTAGLKGNVTLSSHNDHRILMALAVLASIAEGPVTIEGAEAVKKSYPAFFDDLAVTEIGVKTYD